LKDKAMFILKAAISLALMVYLFYYFLSRPIERETLINIMATADLRYFLLAVLLFMTAVVTNALKWYILLHAQGIPVPLIALINYTFVGFFFNNFLPANVGGDVMRGVGLAQYTTRKAESAVSVIVDRIMGLMAFMFTAVVSAFIAVHWVMPQQPDINGALLAENLAQVEWVAFVGMAVLLGGFAIMLSYRLRQLVGQLFKFRLLVPLAPIYQRLSEAFGAYRYEYYPLIAAFGVGVLTVVLTGCVDLAIVAGLHGEIDPIYIFLLNPIIAVALIAPVSVGGLGTGSLLYVYFYGLVGVSQPLAFALSLIKQLVVYAGSLPGGILWLQRRQQSRQAAELLGNVEG